jgi:predicted secreted Zn-dependent protease
MLAWPSPGFAEVVVSERTEHYLLDGATADDLRRQLAQRGPMGRERAVAAITRHALSVQYWRRQTGDVCEAYGIRVEMEITMRLPRWRPRQAPAPALADQWRRLEHGLRLHEQGHRDNGVEAAHRLDARLREIGAAPDCGRLKLAFDASRREARQALQMREDAFDRDTDHGRRWLRAQRTD